MILSLPKLLYSAAQSRDIDRSIIESSHIPGVELMERAGAAAFEQLRQRWPGAAVAVFCGSGNNGGDGYIVARLVLEAGQSVRVYALGDDERLSPDARRAKQRYEAKGGEIEHSQSAELAHSTVIVDALFGTGLDRVVAGEWRAAIDAINQSGKPVLALDCPSGLHADTGRVLGIAVRADATVTFITLKCGLLTGQAGDYCGELVFDDLSVGRHMIDWPVSVASRLELPDFQAELAPRQPSGHKGCYGHVLVVGGGPGMPGAPHLSGQAAYRSGAGLVTLAVHEVNAHKGVLGCPELMTLGIVDRTALQPLMNKASVLALGPGLGQSEWSRTVFEAALDFDGPTVVDADGLNWLAQRPENRTNWILTPHPAEAARLLGCATRDVQNDRFAAALDIQRRYGGVCVLKGFGTVIVDDAGISVCTYGNPGMGSGGMGDVLTGVIAGLLAQFDDLSVAAKLGVCVHGRAGDIAAADGQRGLLASDLMNPIRKLVNPR